MKTVTLDLTERQFIGGLEMVKGVQYHVPHFFRHLCCGCTRPRPHSRYPTLKPYHWREWYVEFDASEGVFIHTECKRSLTRRGSYELEDTWYTRTVINPAKVKHEAA